MPFKPFMAQCHSWLKIAFKGMALAALAAGHQIVDSGGGRGGSSGGNVGASA